MGLDENEVDADFFARRRSFNSDSMRSLRRPCTVGGTLSGKFEEEGHRRKPHDPTTVLNYEFLSALNLLC